MTARVPGAAWNCEVTLRLETEENTRKEPGFLVTSWSCYMRPEPSTSKLYFFKPCFIESYVHHYLYIIKKKPTDNKTDIMLSYCIHTKVIPIAEMLNCEK